MSRRRIGFWYRLAAVIAKPPLIAVIKRDWRGMENIPAEGGFLTAVNHNSHLDPLCYAHFQYNTGRVPRFLAKDPLFKPFFVGSFMRGTGQIPVFRATADAADAFRAAVDAVNSGECVVFYPEGTLTRDPDQWPMMGKTGVARVALMTKAPGHPDRPVGRQRAAAAVHHQAQALPAQDPPGAGRAAGRPVGVLRPGDDRRAAAQGHRRHHGGDDRAARRTAR